MERGDRAFKRKDLMDDWLGKAGEAAKGRKLKDISPWLHFFPKARGQDKTVKRNAGLQHTLRFIPKMVSRTLWQTARFAPYMVGPTLEDTCRNIWQWVYDHIRYVKDETFKEQVRSARRLVADAKGDCDCMTGFIDNVLCNVRRITGWPFEIVNRIAKYRGPNFQHIYPVVMLPNGRSIIMDCVTEHFNYEEPYSEKEDHAMDLEYLDGLDDSDDEFFREEETMGELGKLKLLQKAGKKVGSAIKKAVHATNKVNPATVLLRTGLLASMKLNLMNVAGRLKWTYLSAAEAKKKGLNMGRWAKALKIREKLEKIFYGAGGQPENLREAILTGKGNKGKEVSGPPFEPQEEQTLRDIIGNDLYEREALSGLGVIETAAITASSAALAAIAALLKEIGSLKEGTPNSENPQDSGEQITAPEVPPSSPDQEEPGPGSSERDTQDTTDSAGDEDKAPGFFDNPMEWAKANPGKAAFGALLTMAVIYGGYKLATRNKEQPQIEQRTVVQQRTTRAPRKQEDDSQEREQVRHVPLSD
ncbi:MAG: hypothetical protein AB1458_12080 [Bacteroidota bacterium]